MTALQTALEVVFPTFFLIGLGALADRLLPELRMETLARLSVYLLIPALVFNAVAMTELSLEAALLIAAAYLLYLLVLGFVSALGSAGLTVAQTARRGRHESFRQYGQYGPAHHPVRLRGGGL